MHGTEGHFEMKARKAHDVRHGLGVPSFGEHPDRDHVPDPPAGLAGAAHGVHLPAQELGALLRVERVALAGPDTGTGQSDAMTSQHEMAW